MIIFNELFGYILDGSLASQLISKRGLNSADNDDDDEDDETNWGIDILLKASKIPRKPKPAIETKVSLEEPSSQLNDQHVNGGVVPSNIIRTAIYLSPSVSTTNKNAIPFCNVIFIFSLF
jgi:hypothetical protein